MHLRTLILASIFMVLPHIAMAKSATMSDVTAAHQAGEYDKAKTLLDELIIRGNAHAMAAMGQLYLRGDGVEKSEEKAWAWSLRAVNRFKTEENYHAAIAVLQPYVQGGRVNAQIEQAVIAIRAGSDEQRESGKTFIKNLAENGNGQAQYEQAKIAYSAGTTKDEKWAARMKWLKLSAENGYPPGQNGYGTMQGFNVPAIGQKKDETKKFEWQKKAADNGYAGAQYNVGNRYEYGTGVAKSEETAVKYYQKAANQGNFSAMMRLGSAYAFGVGTAQNKDTAIYWYKRVYDGAHHRNSDKFEAKRRMEKLGWTP